MSLTNELFSTTVTRLQRSTLSPSDDEIFMLTWIQKTSNLMEENRFYGLKLFQKLFPMRLFTLSFSSYKVKLSQKITHIGFFVSFVKCILGDNR